MKVNSATISAKVADVEQLLNYARTIEGLQNDGIDAITEFKEKLKFDGSILIDGQEAAQGFANKLGFLNVLVGFKERSKGVGIDVSDELESMYQKALKDIEETYGLTEGDLS